MSHQTVRLSRGSHRSQSAGACAMELASMLAHESFSDRPDSVSPVIGAFLRTYNDGLDDRPRQDLYPIATEVVDTAGPPSVERERVDMCLAFLRELAAAPPRRPPPRRSWPRRTPPPAPAAPARPGAAVGA